MKISDDVGDMDLGMHKLEVLADQFSDLAVVDSDVPQKRLRSVVVQFEAGKSTQLHMINRLNNVMSGEKIVPNFRGCGWC